MQQNGSGTLRREDPFAALPSIPLRLQAVRMRRKGPPLGALFALTGVLAIIVLISSRENAGLETMRENSATTEGEDKPC